MWESVSSSWLLANLEPTTTTQHTTLYDALACIDSTITTVIKNEEHTSFKITFTIAKLKAM